MKKFLLSAAVAMAPLSAADAAYSFNFHYDAQGNFAAADVGFRAESLNPSALFWYGGSLNGFTPDELYYDGHGFAAMAPPRAVSVGAIDGMQFPLVNSAPGGAPIQLGTYTTTQAGRVVYSGNGISTFGYTTGSLTVTHLPNYYFDFHFGASGTSPAAEIIYSADTLNPATLDYYSGSVNGFSSASLYYDGHGFAAYDYSGSMPVGSVNGIQFSTTSTINQQGTYAADQAGRSIYADGGSSDFSYSTGFLTISSNAPRAVPEPATWALMIIGMGAIGTSMRRSRQPRVVQNVC